MGGIWITWQRIQYNHQEVTQQTRENDAWAKWEYQQRENILRRTKQILELKNPFTALKFSVEGFNSRLDQREERIQEPKDKSFEIIQAEEQE